MKIHLSSFLSLYNAILDNFSIFKILYEKNREFVFIEGSKKKSYTASRKKKKKKNQANKGNIEHVEKMIKILNWDMTKFIREWGRIKAYMLLIPFKRKIHVAKGWSNLLIKVLTMSGLKCNITSKVQNWD